ncbi:MAG TPA: hypothetical protein VNQ76_16040 [Planctomicrobium sp.]|nr:hypothetical protein [Planctomicrobium sp.]
MVTYFQRGFLLAVGLTLGLLSSVATVWACPFCDTPSTTYSEQLKEAPAVLFVHWDSAEKPDALNFEPGSATYRVVHAYRQPGTDVMIGDLIKIPFYQSGQPGDSFWMLGSVTGEETEEDADKTTARKLNWSPPVAMSQQCWDYAIQGPQRDLPIRKRLPYYLPYLEHADPDIAMDAYGEFAGAPYDDVLAMKEQMPRENLLKWLTDAETIPSRRGLYGLMLGLCGTPDDATAIEPILLEQPRDARLGIDGMMAGYVLLTGETGLKKLTDAKLVNRDVISSESFAMLQTLRFLWQYAPHAAPKEDLITSMRLLLDHPQYASFAIIDLARWQDWDTVELLIERYGHGIYADRHVKMAVIRFLLLAAYDAPSGSAKSISLARITLNELRLTEPELLESVERKRFD